MYRRGGWPRAEITRVRSSPQTSPSICFPYGCPRRPSSTLALTPSHPSQPVCCFVAGCKVARGKRRRRRRRLPEAALGGRENLRRAEVQAPLPLHAGEVAQPRAEAPLLVQAVRRVRKFSRRQRQGGGASAHRRAEQGLGRRVRPRVRAADGGLAEGEVEEVRLVRLR